MKTQRDKRHRERERHTHRHKETKRQRRVQRRELSRPLWVDPQIQGSKEERKEGRKAVTPRLERTVPTVERT